MTAASLRALTRKALAARAKKHQIAGWHEMTKDELVTALAVSYRRQLARSRTSRNGAAERNGRNGSSHLPVPEAKTERRFFHNGPSRGRRLLKASMISSAPSAVRDSLVAVGTDPCWVHVRWTLSRETLNRAEAAMGVHWHHSVPVLRVLDITGDDLGASAQTRVCDVEIHGDVDHWYLPVDPAPHRYRIQLGYRAPNGSFFVMAQSNRVQTPRPGAHSLEARLRKAGNRTSASSEMSLDLEKRPTYDLRALPTSRLPVPRPITNGNGEKSDESEVPAEPPVELQLHAELILHGSTDPQVELKLLGERVPVSRDGTFSQRFTLPEGRQVIDAVATTRNGCHQRTIVLGIERNTKELEPQWFDQIEP